MTNFTLEGKGKDNIKEIKEAMIKRADEALYKSKKEGRNRTTVAMRGINGETEFTEITPKDISEKNSLVETNYTKIKNFIRKSLGKKH